jgi:hypothetical protein
MEWDSTLLVGFLPKWTLLLRLYVAYATSRRSLCFVHCFIASFTDWLIASLLGHCFTNCPTLHYATARPAPGLFKRTTQCSPTANRMPWTEQGRLTFGLGGGRTSKGITHVFESPTRRAARSSGKGLQSTKGQPRRSYFAIASFSDLRKCVRRRHIPRSTNVVRGNRQ